MKFLVKAPRFERQKSRVHPHFIRADEVTYRVIAAAIEVHRDKGPGLMEAIYEWCLLCELQLRGLSAINQQTIDIHYKSFVRRESLRLDVLVEGCVMVEIKAVERILPVHKAQLLSYMKLLDVPLGVLINFNSPKVTDGISRLILDGADRD